MNKAISFTLLIALFAATSLVAGPDDKKWVDQCIKDNKGEESAAVVKKYCECMNEEMSDSEEMSITQWEKTANGKKAEVKCDKASGWKSKKK